MVMEEKSMLFSSYKNPPINEVVCGMRFHSNDKLCYPHVGFLWEKFKDDYPIIKHANPIINQPNTWIDETTGFPLPRVWFINKSDDKLIQFQFDRFYFNWRKRQDIYPRYSYIISSFEKLYDTIQEFYKDFNFDEFMPLECELTYVNHIPNGKGWETLEDISKIFRDFTWQKKEDRFLSYPEEITWNISFPIEKERGTLHVKLRKSTLKKDNNPVIILELQAKGVCITSNKETIREWFDLAHKYIAHGFNDLTTPIIQEFWGKQNYA